VPPSVVVAASTALGATICHCGRLNRASSPRRLRHVALKKRVLQMDVSDVSEICCKCFVRMKQK
jgi:hypothetical protein